MILSLLVCLVGGIVHYCARPENARGAELGRLAFGVGLFVFLLNNGGEKLFGMMLR